MHLENVVLISRTPAMVDAWAEAFADEETVSARCADFFSQPADAMLSPANSFGIMDGGLDLAIRDHVGFDTETRLQQAIVNDWHGELPVGAAIVVPTSSEEWPFLVSAPTMRVPEPVPDSLNAYLAFRAALIAILRHNATSPRPIRSLVAPGLCAGIGRMSPRRCAGQMRAAWRQVRSPARIPSFDMIWHVHEALTTAG